MLAFVFWPAAIVTGHLARRRIRRTGEGGAGLALAGIIVGYAYAVLFVVLLGFAFAIPLPFTSTTTGRPGRAVQSNVTNALTATTALYAQHRSFPPQENELLLDLALTQREIAFVAGTTAPGAGRNVVSVDGSATGQVVILAGAGSDGTCWVGALNEGAVPVNGVPPGHSFGERTGRGCAAEQFASAGALHWWPNFKTVPAATAATAGPGG